MPKGRNHVPSASNDGVWFEHRGITVNWPPNRREQTNTGVMLEEPYRTDRIKYPPTPPHKYNLKDSRNFKTQNNFSAHDNRNSFQDHGVYFEDGRDNRILGKRITAPVERQHHTEKDYLKHYGRSSITYDYNTVYSATFEGKPTNHPPIHRRFPKVHKDGVPGFAKLDTTTTDWYTPPEIPYKTPTQVLATSQEPFLKHNNFKYSYHGLPKCYPSYDKAEKKRSYPVWLVQGSAKSHEIQA